MNFLKEDTGILQQYKSIYLEQKSSKEETINKLSNFLEGGLKPYAADFVEAGKKYGVDPFLTASIAMLETGRGKAPVLTRNKNISGRWDNTKKTHYTYSNVRDSIHDQARFLKAGYLDKGLNTIPEIGKKYAPPGAANDPNNTNKDWPANVTKLYAQATGSSTSPIFSTSPETMVASTDEYGRPIESETGVPLYRNPAAALAGLAGGLGALKQAATGQSSYLQLAANNKKQELNNSDTKSTPKKT